MADDLPETVDLNWLARQLLAMRRDLQSLRDDTNVSIAILRRVENNQNADRAEWRSLFDMLRHVRERVDALEQERP